MAKKNKKASIPKSLLILLIITGISTLVLNMINRRLLISELGELTGYIGTAFAICLIIIIGIWLLNQVKQK